MKLIYPKVMTKRQTQNLKICLATQTASVTKSEVLESLIGQLSAMGDGINVIDAEIAISQIGTIDILAADASKKPLFIDVGTTLDADKVCWLFKLMDWAESNKEILSRAYANLDWDNGIRVWHFTGIIDPETHPLLKKIQNSQLEIFRYNCIDLHGTKWLMVENFFAGKDTQELSFPRKRESIENHGSPIKTLGDDKQNRHSLNLKSVLTTDEIDDFFSPRHDNEEVTVKGYGYV